MTVLRTTCALVLVAATLLLGCENTVDPFSRDAGNYSVYGALAVHQNQHFVRVKPFQMPLRNVPDEALPATVTLRNESTGTTHTLRDSVTQYEGIAVHNYHGTFRLRPETEYQLTVDGPEGTTRAVAVTPSNESATIDAVGTGSYPTRPPFSTNGNDSGSTTSVPASAPPDTVDLENPPHCLTRFAVRLEKKAQIRSVSIGVSYEGADFWIQQTPKVQPRDDGGRGFNFVPERLLEHIEEDEIDNPFTCEFFEGRCLNLDSGHLRIAYTYLGPEWYGNRPPDDVRKPINWLRSSQVQDGVGFLGSYYRDTVSVNIHRGVVDLGPDGCDPKP